nr:hypothetical protein [Tanacetum cinerariifolium]GEY37657.1 hypothetical protein [Tanacetum cinerariifolium]GEY40267.1 hypothetical protein [Tanacetum cinerariifolium]
MGKDTVQLETAVNTISQEYLLEFTSKYGIPEALHPELPGPENRIVDFPEGKVDERVFPTVVDWRTSAPKDRMPTENTYSAKAVRTLDTHRTPIQKQPEMLLCLVGISRRYYLGDEVYGLVQFDPCSQSHKDPLSFAEPQSRHPPDVSHMLDTPEACQDLVDHVAPPGYFSKLRHLHNDDFLRQYNVNLARQVAMGSQLRLRFEQEAKLLRKSVARVARRDKIIQAREHEIKNLEALLEAEANMKKAAEDKSAMLSQELEDMRALFSDLQVSNDRLYQQVATLQEQVSGEEKLKAAFEEFKRYEDSQVEQRCAEMDACLDALSIDFDEELYLHMLTAIAYRRWMIGHGLRLTVMNCGESLELRQAFADVMSAGIAKGMSEGLRHGVEHRQAQLTLESLEVYDPEVKTKYIAALQVLKDLRYPLVDQLEGLKDAPMDVIMAALYLESDTEDDAPQWVCDLRPSSSQLTIPVYPELRDPVSPWACKEEMLLVDAIAANVSCMKKKKKYHIVCRTHGVGSVHHARSDGVPVSTPTVIPQGLALLLADAATQTDTD